MCIWKHVVISDWWQQVPHFSAWVVFCVCNVVAAATGGQVDGQSSSDPMRSLSGIYIKHVKPDSPAGATGSLKDGDRILEVCILYTGYSYTFISASIFAIVFQVNPLLPLLQWPFSSLASKKTYGQLVAQVFWCIEWPCYQLSLVVFFTTFSHVL